MSKKILLKKVKNKIKNYRSNFKNEIDSYVDPILFKIASNGAMLWAGNEGLEYISQNISQKSESLESLAMIGGYAFLGASLYYGNKFIVNPLAKKIREIKAKRFYDGALVGAESWIRTSAQIGGMVALYFLSSFNNAINNYSYDFNRVMNAFARPKIVVEKKKELTDKIMEDFPLRKNDEPFDAGALEGYELSGLYSTLTGLKGKVPKKISVDFDKQLLKMFEFKSKISNNKVIDTEFKELVEGYVNGVHTYMTLEQYISEADKSIDSVNKNIDWKKVGELKGLNQLEIKLLESIAKSLNGRDLLAYGLTELMPSQTDGQKNMIVLDFLLRNAGREYVELIPALGDDLTSFGIFQFTSYALYNVNGEKRGASIINQALSPDKRIPDSVVKLKGNDHFKAAYMFATNNIADMIKELTRSQQSILLNSGAKNKSEIIKYIAASHYKPFYARKSAGPWLNNGGNDDFLKTVHPQVKAYARKTHVNWYALYGLEIPSTVYNGTENNIKNKTAIKNNIDSKMEFVNNYIDKYIDTKNKND